MPKPLPKAGQLTARPDWYVRRLRDQLHQMSQESRQSAVQLHRSFDDEIVSIAKSEGTATKKNSQYLSVVDRFQSRYRKNVLKSVNDSQDHAATEAHKIINLMLPRGVQPPGQVVTSDTWKLKGKTTEERLARVHIRTLKRMRTITTRSFKGALSSPVLPALGLTPGEVDEAVQALQTWEGTASLAASLAGNEPWVAGMVGMASTFDSSVDVIDHYEWLATLDNVTCDECASQDGTEIPTSEIFGEDEEPIIDEHPNCRCVAIPITKTWDELGFEGIQEPEGDRIARPYYPENGDWGKSSPTGYVDPDGKIYPDYQPGRQPVGGVQEYTPADTRYTTWEKGRYAI